MSVLNIKWRRDWFQLGSKVERFISGSWIPWPLLCLFKNSLCCQVHISTGIVPAHSNLWTVSSHCVGDWLGQTSVWKMLLISCMGTWKNSAQAHGLLLFNLPAQTWLYCSHFSGFLFLVFTFSWQTHRVFCCIQNRDIHIPVSRGVGRKCYIEKQTCATWNPAEHHMHGSFLSDWPRRCSHAHKIYFPKWKHPLTTGSMIYHTLTHGFHAFM